MNQYCFICNARAGIALRNAVNIFGEHNTLQSGKSLVEVLSEIVDKPVREKDIHSKILCSKCHKACSEYDSIQVRLKVIKLSMVSQFRATLPRHNLKYETYNKEPTPQKFEGKKIVLPASKLQPLPPDFVLKGGKLPSQSMAALALKLNNSIKTTGGMTGKVQRTSPAHKVTSSVTSSLSSYVTSSRCYTTTKTTSPVLTFTLNEPPKDIFSSGELTQIISNKDQESAENNDDHEMEIDEDCTLAVMSATEGDAKLSFEETNDKNDGDKSKSSFFDVDLLAELASPAREDSQNKYILGKIEMMNEDDDQRTIVMKGEGESIIRVLSGQKILYGGKKISFVVPEDPDLEDQDNGDAQDSNDESQFEWQVSGDEETANAIIAAAQEQGAAIIKVETGEMFRVESIESKAGDAAPAEDNMLLEMVAKEKGKFKCLMCERNDKDGPQFTGSAASTTEHMRAAHDARIHICHVCGLVVRKRAEYLAHLSKHKNIVPLDKNKIHECKICNKKYNSRGTLAEHMHTHSGARPYTCSMCAKSFASKYTLQSHLKTHLDRPRPFKCNLCGKSFLTQQNLNQHKKTHSGVKEFVCKICGKAFGALHNLEVHGVVHSGNKPFVCGVCSKAFARRAEVRDHMRIHTGERPFSCEVCGARFTQRSNLHSHRRATHLDDKRHHCQLCPKRFKRRRLLDYHVKASHTGERPLQCEVCQAAFVYPEHFKKHMRIHSGEKPYKCEVCGRAFNTRDNLNTHRYTHSDKKPYECVVCGAGYMRKQQLYLHMKNSGHLAESIVVNQPRILKVPQSVVTSAGSIIIDPGKEDSTSNFKSSGIFEDHETEEKPIGNPGIDIVHVDEVSSLITLHNIDDDKDDSLLDAVPEEQMSQDSEQITTEDSANSEVRKFIQLQLPNGRSGWFAV